MTGDVQTDLDLFLAVRACALCPLTELRGSTGMAVPAEVGPLARRPLLGFLAEAPGRQENETGRPLVGPAGRKFEGLLRGAGVDRASVLLMNTVRCRPPNNALASHPYASEACDHWTKAEFSVYNPEVVVLLGKTAISRVFPGAQLKVGEVRGQVRSTGENHEYGARLWVPTYHPAALTRRHSVELDALVSADIALAASLLTVRGR